MTNFGWKYKFGSEKIIWIRFIALNSFKWEWLDGFQFKSSFATKLRCSSTRLNSDAAMTTHRVDRQESREWANWHRVCCWRWLPSGPVIWAHAQPLDAKGSGIDERNVHLTVWNAQNKINKLQHEQKSCLKPVNVIFFCVLGKYFLKNC